MKHCLMNLKPRLGNGLRSELLFVLCLLGLFSLSSVPMGTSAGRLGRDQTVWVKLHQLWQQGEQAKAAYVANPNPATKAALDEAAAASRAFFQANRELLEQPDPMLIELEQLQQEVIWLKNQYLSERTPEAMDAYLAALDEYRALGDEISERRGGIGPQFLSGGPDGFGYIFKDETELDGPTFSFVDISGTGTLLPTASSTDDGGETSAPFGFTFNFYGADYTDVGVSSNGYLTFGADLSDFTNDCPVPNTTDPNDLIAPFWDDVSPNQNGSVFEQNFVAPCPNASGGTGPCSVFQWDDVEFFAAGTNRATFQAILYNNGNILFQYPSTPDIADSATVGIENSTGTDGLSHTCGASGGGIFGGRAILYIHPQNLQSVVPVDIRPGSCPNPLNTKQQGVLPVAILGTVDFDVTQVDLSTVQLEGVSPLRSSLSDVATPFTPFTGKGDCLLDCTDAGPDGLLDLALHFDAQAVIAALGSVTDGECLVVTLTGDLLDGTSITGEDVVRVIDR